MSYGSEAAALNALLSIFAGFWLIILAFFVLNIVAGWKIFGEGRSTRMGV